MANPAIHPPVSGRVWNERPGWGLELLNEWQKVASVFLSEHPNIELKKGTGAFVDMALILSFILRETSSVRGIEVHSLSRTYGKSLRS